MADLDAALTTLNNTINNTISDNFPSFGYDEKNGFIEDEVIHLLGRTYILPKGNIITFRLWKLCYFGLVGFILFSLPHVSSEM